MSNKISEQAPQAPQPSGGAIDKVRKQARQLAYDVRYKVKGMFKDGQKTNPSALLQAYMKQLAASSAPGPVKALAKSMLSGGNRESYDFFDIEKNISESRSKVFSNVFSEGKEAFVLRVKDADAGSEYERSYMNYEAASRKARELRAKKGVTVEITKKEPKATYDQKGGKPNDGNLANNREPYDKVTRGDVIAGATGNDEMGGKRKVNKEEVIYETEDSNEKTIDVMPKGKKNTVKVSPVAEQIKAELAAISQKKIDEANAAAVKNASLNAKKKQEQAIDANINALKKQKQAMRTEDMEAVRYCPKCDKDETRDECRYGGEYWDENSKPAKAMDPREVRTRINLAKNKLRSMGLKMSYDMEGEMVDEASYTPGNERPFPYGKVGDKLRKVAGERDTEKDPKKRNKLASRFSKIKREYDLPEELSVDQQMKISQEYNRMSPEEKRAANKKAMGNVKKVAPKKDTRTDAQKMTDATGPRPGSRYRGD